MTRHLIAFGRAAFAEVQLTSESAGPAKTPGAMSQDKMGTAPVKKDSMTGTTGMSNDNMKKNGMAKDGMAKDGMKK